jgi:hypothetical protein
MTTTAQRPVAASPAVRRPSTGWYWVAGAVVLAAAAAGVLWFGAAVRSMTRHAESFPRTGIPGSLTFAVAEPGTRYVYVEADESPALEELGATLHGPEGASVPLRPYDLDVRYDAYDRTGRAVATFRARTTGTYRLVVTNGPGGYVAVGDDLGDGVIWSLLGALLIGFGGLLAGGALAVWVAIRRGSGSNATGARQ